MLSAAWPGQGQEYGGAKKWNTNLNRDVTRIEVYIYIYLFIWKACICVNANAECNLYTYIHIYIYIYIYIAQVPKQKLEPLEARLVQEALLMGSGRWSSLTWRFSFFPTEGTAKWDTFFHNALATLSQSHTSASGQPGSGSDRMPAMFGQNSLADKVYNMAHANPPQQTSLST